MESKGLSPRSLSNSPASVRVFRNTTCVHKCHFYGIVRLHTHTRTHTHARTHTHTVHVTAAMYRTHMPACLPIYPWIAVIAVKLRIFTEFQSHTLQIARLRQLGLRITSPH